MIVHNFDPVLVDFGILQIRWYSIAYIVGIILAWIYSLQIIKNIGKNNQKFITEKIFDDLIIYIILGIIIGGRLGYVILYNFDYYVNNFNEIIKIWEGGMSFHGGLLGVIISTVIFSKVKKTNFFYFTDVLACSAPLGLFLGRIANFINGELFGKASLLPWSVIFPGESVPRHPSQIYEALLEGVLLFILINFFAFKKKVIFKTGLISGLFLIFYSALRILGEIFREPDQHLGYILNYFSVGTMLSLITLLAGCIIIFQIKKNEQNL